MNNFKNTKLARNIKENRAVYITAVTLLVALAVIITLTAVANRSKKPVETQPPESKPTETTQKPTEKEPDKNVMDELPAFVLPVSGKLTKSHDADMQVFSNTMQDYRVHLGLDICAEEGAEVRAVADGTVVEVWEDDLMGQCVAISHGGDAVSVYKNLSLTIPEGIAAGAKVTAGVPVGYVGDTAMVELADESHLHFELTVAGIQVDPLDYFGEDSVATLAEDTSYEDVVSE